MLAGPLVGALVLDAASPAAALGATAACAAVGAAIAWRLPYEAADAGGGATAGGRRVARVLADTAEGVRALRRSAAARLLVGLGCVQTFIRGAFNVFLVVVAIDLLETGEAGVGVLSSALGVGGVVGAFGASLLAGSRALARVFAVGVALWGIPLIVIAGLPVNAAALAMVAVIGIANALIDVAFFTLLGRLADEVVLARVLGLAEMLFALAIGLGSIAAPLAIAAAGAPGALVLVGLLGPVPALLAWRALGRIDDTLAVRSNVIYVLQTVPLLRPLPVPAIERLAEAAVHEAVPAGATVFSEGDQGDRFYVIHAGEADVYGNGRHIRVMAPGDGFGEIALLRDLPRTATVSARSDLDLYSLCRDQFVPAVTNLRSSACAAAGLIEARLTTYPGPVTAA